ncbi:MAG TPA: hypothetical protein PKK06_10470 [Phycisphaerae bacterium]|nr:hypothetical protein [Phycisphaerae bacterium]HNU45787.1 hypothetical protein [Phycisphaerae bacterium]
MGQQRLWSRIGRWFSGESKGGNGHHPGEVDAATGLIGCAAQEARDFGTVEAATPAALCPTHRVPNRERLLERLEEGYERVSRLVESIQTHVQTQDQRSAEALRTLASLGQSLEHLPTATAAQNDSLAQITQLLETQAARSKRLDEHLAQWPRLADAQRETMASVGRQLDLNRQAGEQVAASLDRLGEAMRTLGGTTARAAETIRELESHAAEREQRLALALRERTSRLAWFVGGVTALALAGLITALVALLG